MRVNEIAVQQAVAVKVNRPLPSLAECGMPKLDPTLHYINRWVVLTSGYLGCMAYFGIRG